MARYQVPNRAALVRASIANGILLVPREAAASGDAPVTAVVSSVSL
jgi:hypothetical protein